MVDKVIIHITAEDAEQRDSEDEIYRDVVNRQWIEDVELPNKYHQRIGRFIFLARHTFVERNALGEVLFDGMVYVLHGTPDDIIVRRVPDVSFVRSENIDPSNEGFYYIAPDLAVEVVSPAERKKKTADKVRDYLTYGTQQVWVVYPDEKRVVVHTPFDVTEFGEGDTLTGGELLPDFAVDITDIF